MDLAQIDGDITLDGIKRGMNESLQAYSEQLTLLVSGQEDKYKGKGYTFILFKNITITTCYDMS